MIGDPLDPFAALIDAAPRTHALYSAYVDAGFSPQEAIVLVSQILTSGVLDEEDAE